MFVVKANNMAKPLSHSDLLLYFYGEAEADTVAFIQANIAENPDWSNYLTLIASWSPLPPQHCQLFWKKATQSFTIPFNNKLREID